MARKINKRGPVAPAMNITPLIDVVFLLIIFFMIVSKIVSDEREPMIVPRLTNPEATKLQTENRIIVNVARQNPQVNERKDMLGKGGVDNAHLAGTGQAAYVKVGGYTRYSMNELGELTELLRQRRQARPKLEVLLRADSALYCNQVAPVMNAITQAKIAKVNMVAYTDEQPF